MKYPGIVCEIEKSLYVDDLISGEPTQAKAETVKSALVEIFAKGTFELHKWHSNVKELETACSVPVSEEEKFAKEQLGTSSFSTRSTVEQRAIPSALASHQRAPCQQSEGFLANGPDI